MRRLFGVLALMAALVTGLLASDATVAQAPARVALVIGNASYRAAGWALANPANDARLIAQRLAALGFSVTTVTDATRPQMEAAMSAFGQRLRAGGPQAVGVFYYAGHGVEEDGANLLVPVDVTAGTLDELAYQAPRMQFVLRDMARAGNAVNIVILDACRNLPLPDGTRSGPAGGLADLADVPDNVLIAYATRPGLTAPDNPGQSNSVFTRTLAEALARAPSETAVNLFSSVQARVFASTGGVQRPEFRSGLLRAPDWRFASAAPPPVDPELERLRRENEALRRQTAPPPQTATTKAAPATSPPRTESRPAAPEASGLALPSPPTADKANLTAQSLYTGISGEWRREDASFCRGDGKVRISVNDGFLSVSGAVPVRIVSVVGGVIFTERAIQTGVVERSEWRIARNRLTVVTGDKRSIYYRCS